MTMDETRNEALAFPDSRGRLHLAELRCDPLTSQNAGDETFKFAKYGNRLPKQESVARAVNAMVNTRDPKRRDLVRQYDKLRLHMHVTGQDIIAQDSYGLLAALATLMVWRRSDLYRSNSAGMQSALALAATGVLGADGQVGPVDNLEAKLRALVHDGGLPEDFAAYAQCVFVMPKQPLTKQEQSALKAAQDAGWTTLQVDSVFAPELQILWPDAGSQGAPASGGWGRPVAVAACVCAAVALAGLYLGQRQEGATAAPIALLTPDTGEAPQTSPRLSYRGQLKVDVVPISAGARTLAVAPGHIFGPDDLVDLDVLHTGPGPAVVMIYRDTRPSVHVVLTAGETRQLRHTLSDLTGKQGNIALRAASCDLPCDAAKVELAGLTGQADPEKTLPAGAFKTSAERDRILDAQLALEIVD